MSKDQNPIWPGAPEGIDWGQSDGLKILQALAWAICKHEGAGRTTLWGRVREVLPRVSGALTCTPKYTLDDVCHQVRADQGAELTPTELYRCAEEAQCYLEFNEFKYVVEYVYCRLDTDEPVLALQDHRSVMATFGKDDQGGLVIYVIPEPGQFEVADELLTHTSSRCPAVVVDCEEAYQQFVADCSRWSDQINE